MNAVNDVATFSDVRLNTVGAGFTLIATLTGTTTISVIDGVASFANISLNKAAAAAV